MILNIDDEFPINGINGHFWYQWLLLVSSAISCCMPMLMVGIHKFVYCYSFQVKIKKWLKNCDRHLSLLVEARFAPGLNNATMHVSRNKTKHKLDELTAFFLKLSCIDLYTSAFKHSRELSFQIICFLP